MSEKKGNLIKLHYDFNEAFSCEIYLDSIDKWVRLTPREFRSYVGKRRILNVSLKEPEYQDYEGPVYYFGTNKICHDLPNKKGLLYYNNIDPRDQFRNLPRPHHM
jgi:hypothetical protein